jgi:hypothetical protein
MAHTDRSDEFAARGFEPYGPDPDQLDLFGPPPAGSRGPDPAGVRAEPAGILARTKPDGASARASWPQDGNEDGPGQTR